MYESAIRRERTQSVRGGNTLRMIDDDDGHSLLALFEFQSISFFEVFENRDACRNIGTVLAGLRRRRLRRPIQPEIIDASDAGRVNNRAVKVPR
jgi:hypothetical protein